MLDRDVRLARPMPEDATDKPAASVAQVEGQCTMTRSQVATPQIGIRRKLRARQENKRAIWRMSIRRDGVVPFAAEFGTFDVDGGHLGVRYEQCPWGIGWGRARSAR